MRHVKLLSLVVLSCTCYAAQTEVLVYRSVESTTITGGGKRIPLSIKGTLVLDYDSSLHPANNGLASAAYIGKISFKGQKFYFLDDLQFSDYELVHNEVITRNLPGRPEQGDTYLTLSFQRFAHDLFVGVDVSDQVKGSTRLLSITTPTPSTPSQQVELASSFRGGVRRVFRPSFVWYALESRSTYVFMRNDTFLANDQGLTSVACIQAQEAYARDVEGYRKLTSLDELLSLVP